MNKKASSHLDWVISVGIFLVYILLMIIFLKPGVEPLERKSYLLDLAQYEFNKLYTINVDKTPLVINRTMLTELEVMPSYLTMPFPFDSIYNKDDFTVLDSYGNYLNTSFVTNALGETNISFETDLGRGPNIYYIIYSNNSNMSKKLVTKTKYYELTPSNFTFRYGATKTINGFSEEKFNILKNNCTSNYDLTKQNIFNLPKTNNLRIYWIVTLNQTYDPKGVDYLCNPALKPGQQEDVVTKSWKNFLLNKTGDKQEIMLHIEVW